LLGASRLAAVDKPKYADTSAENIMTNKVTLVRNTFKGGTYDYLIVRGYDSHSQVVLGKLAQGVFWPNDKSFTADDLVDIGNAIAAHAA
jgi:hypothetical protein